MRSKQSRLSCRYVNVNVISQSFYFLVYSKSYLWLVLQMKGREVLGCKPRLPIIASMRYKQMPSFSTDIELHDITTLSIDQAIIAMNLYKSSKIINLSIRIYQRLPMQVMSTLSTLWFPLGSSRVWIAFQFRELFKSNSSQVPEDNCMSILLTLIPLCSLWKKTEVCPTTLDSE